jgi:superfamily II DNA or RNA helicase
VDAAILLRKTQSLGLYLQQVGRVLRPAEGKQAVILDHVGNIAKHGLAEDEREWTLEGVEKKDAKKGEVSRTKQCGGCYAVYDRFRNSSCPECGHIEAPKIPEQTEGELVEIKRIEKAPLRDLMKEVKTREDLKRIAKVKGYKPGWIWHAAKDLKI